MIGLFNINANNLLGNRTIYSPWICWAFLLSLVVGWGLSALVGRRDPGEVVCGAGRAWSRALGLSGTGWRRAGREGMRGSSGRWRACPSSRKPCWRPRMPWWHSAAPGDRAELSRPYSWEQSGKMACRSEYPCEGRRGGSEREEKEIDVQSVYNPASVFRVYLHTSIGKHGVSLLQVRVQSAPVLKAAVLGLWGVKVRSWSIHWPHSTSRWDRDVSREMFSLWVYKTSWDTLRTCKERVTGRLNIIGSSLV